MLQQYLPFTVLKPKVAVAITTAVIVLQQHLPFTVLKPEHSKWDPQLKEVATALTVYGIETHLDSRRSKQNIVFRCNSTYRLRY